MPTKRSNSRDKNKNINDFPPRRPSAPAPTSATSPRPASTTSTSATTWRGPATRVSKVAIDCQSSMNVAAPSGTTISTRKRGHSPDSINPTSPLPPTKLKSPRKHSNSKRPTPVPYSTSIDPETRTAKLISEIKARAYAANQSNDDEQHLSFRELEDSDDSDLVDELPLVGSAKERSSLCPTPRTRNDVFSSPLSSVPSAFGTPDQGSSPARPVRTSARTRKPAPAFHLPATVSKSSAFIDATMPLPSIHKKAQASNPLLALLREKQSRDKRGTNSAALRLAEEAVRRGSDEALVNSGDALDTINRLSLADEQAAWKAVRESCKSASPVDPGDVEIFSIGDRESKMLGAVAGEAINKILVGNKDNKRKEWTQDAGQKTTLGVPLWIPSSDEDMEVDSMSFLPLSGHPILARLGDFLRCGDDSLVDLVLRSGALDSLPKDTLLLNMPQLLNMTLFASPQVADAFCIAFRDLWGSNPHKIQMPFVAILFALVQLGANFSILEGFGLIPERTQKINVTRETLLKALKRLLVIVKTAGFAAAFTSDDVANVVLSLVILGLDPLTLGELGTELNITMDVVCNYGATDCLLRDIHERVLSFAKQLQPINKVRLVSFFASGSGRTRRIARHLAYCMLVSVPIMPNHQAPPLEPLILLLSPDSGSGEIFDLTNESTDYEELGHYVNILSVALTDIAPYVEEEIASKSSISVQGSPSKPKKPPAPLELLRKVLEVLQSKIVDTRAAHLDRSRTKAAIQRLTLRINYDRMALIGNRPRRRASTLKAYFPPQRS